MQIPKISFITGFIFTTLFSSNTSFAFGDENFYQKLKTQYVPEELRRLFPKNQPIIDFEIGHLNEDSFWDAIVVTTSAEELKDAQMSQILPAKRTVHLLLGNENGFKRSFEHSYLFQDMIEPADAKYNGMVSVQNHKINKMIYQTSDLFSNGQSYPATGGFEIRQNFGNNNSSYIGFIWDKTKKTWIYDGANVVVEIPNGARLVSLNADEETTYNISDFYLGHPSKGNKINLNGHDYIDDEEDK